MAKKHKHNNKKRAGIAGLATAAVAAAGFFVRKRKNPRAHMLIQAGNR